ncbi:MAG: hypothetical protein BAJALOKI3v1_690020 [Promethearchaeota archaeon]|nr:MAG: hypothetical protein BAJALOKI3v1_690020 [Candidatus Lokiarchaeota archaeon]
MLLNKIFKDKSVISEEFCSNCEEYEIQKDKCKQKMLKNSIENLM